MTRGLRTPRIGISLYRKSLDRGICKSCLRDLQSRHASTTAAAVSNADPVPISQANPPVIESTAPHQAYDIKAGIVVSRPPLITRDLTPFEKAYFLYQRRLNERLSLPFTRYFYYQKDTPADLHWKKTIKERLSASRDIGVYSAHGKEAWNDELLVGARESEPQEQVEALLKDAVVEEDESTEDGVALGLKKEKEQIDRPLPRETEADRKNDVRSLNRALARTLYLVVRGAAGEWHFPSGGLIGRESLHRASERLLVEAAGINMNTWIVGHAPVGHYVYSFPSSVVDPETKLETLGEKTFFMKARIMAGQADLTKNKYGLKDFKWLAKEELESEVEAGYWKAVKNMLVDR